MQIKERGFTETFSFASRDKGNLKGFQVIFETWLSRRCFLQEHLVILRRLTQEDLPLFNFKWQRKSLYVNSNMCLKLWESVRLFAAMACVNLVFPSQKLNSNGMIQRDTRRFNAAFSQKIPSVSVVQFTVQMSKLNGIGKTHREPIFVVELKLKLCSLFLY